MDYLALYAEEPQPVEAVWEVLDPGHCEQCYQWSIGEEVWWEEPDTLEGQVQIRDIVKHYEGVVSYA